MMSIVRPLALVTMVISAAASLAGQGRGQQTPPILIESLAGRDSFELYCAACHGSGGRGDGPVAAALRTRPADLTSLARRSGGAFPRDRVRGFIEGTERPLAAHGTAEMPIWESMFGAFESDARVRERIANLQLELAQAVSDQMRLQASAAQGEGRLKRLVAEYGVDRAQAERALGEAIFKKNRVLKALADQRVDLQRWQDAATELEPLAAAGRLAADVAGELQEILSHVDAQAKFVLSLCSSDAVPRSEIETLRSDALRAASLARQFALSKVRQREASFPAEPEYARVSAATPDESLEDL